MAVDSNSLSTLTKQCRDKSTVCMNVVRLKYLWLAPYETWRSRSRQTWLYKNNKNGGPVAKPGTSYHEKGMAVDRIFKDKNWKISWVWNYAYLHKIWFMCWLTPIYKGKAIAERCHLQDDLKTVAVVMGKNSTQRHKSTATDKALLKKVNDEFRKLWYK